MSAPVYLDYNANTPVDPEVAVATEPYLKEHFCNPSSSHTYGRAYDAAMALNTGVMSRDMGIMNQNVGRPMAFMNESVRSLVSGGGHMVLPA